jgi:glutamate--cysteine ligase
MTLTDQVPLGATVVRELAEAEGYIAKVCFKTGPPVWTGVELEWTVHHVDAASRPLHVPTLRTALGPHAPRILDPTSPALPLPGGGTVTVEPGGQVEISTPPSASLAALHRDTAADISALSQRLAGHGLTLGASGIDPHRAPRPVVETPRYQAMARAFDRRGPHGQIMMRCTAGLQICVDAGEPHQVTTRWRALHVLGPPMLAAFATARHHAGRDTGWASARMGAWFGIDPARTRPAWSAEPQVDDPARAWARYALTAPLLCVRRGDGPWDAPPGVTFADWIAGALATPPTLDDLHYHLGTLFPPVRPRGYLELRYLDAQPADEWFAPVAVLAALLSDASTLSAAVDRAAPAADRWEAAARHGLADPAVAAAAHAVLDLACRHLTDTDLPAAIRGQVEGIVRRRLGGLS